MGRIYLTHCSAKKDDSLKWSGKKVFPEKLYTSTRVQRFINKCKEKDVEWAIFSDKYGVVFSNEEIEWYDKPPFNPLQMPNAVVLNPTKAQLTISPFITVVIVTVLHGIKEVFENGVRKSSFFLL